MAIDAKLIYYLHESILDFVKAKLNSPGEINLQLPIIRRSNQAFGQTTPKAPFAVLDIIDTRIIGAPEAAAAIKCMAQVSLFDERSIMAGKNAFGLSYWESKLIIACKDTVNWPVKKWGSGEAVVGYFIALHTDTANLSDANYIGRGLTLNITFNYE